MAQCLLCFQLGQRDANCADVHPDNLGHEVSTAEDSADKKEKKK